MLGLPRCRSLTSRQTQSPLCVRFYPRCTHLWPTYPLGHCCEFSPVKYRSGGRGGTIPDPLILATRSARKERAAHRQLRSSIHRRSSQSPFKHTLPHPVVKINERALRSRAHLYYFTLFYYCFYKRISLISIIRTYVEISVRATLVSPYTWHRPNSLETKQDDKTRRLEHTKENSLGPSSLSQAEETHLIIKTHHRAIRPVIRIRGRRANA